jgi:hypothetical protein
MKPDAPVIPMIRSFPPFTAKIDSPVVPLKEPWRIAAAMTDFDFNLM